MSVRITDFQAETIAFKMSETKGTAVVAHNKGVIDNHTSSEIKALRTLDLPGNRSQYFFPSPGDFDVASSKKAKVARDPRSHRDAEKRRRDRMNNRLKDLRHLIPTHYLHQRPSRLEKAEIIDLAIEYIEDLTRASAIPPPERNYELLSKAAKQAKYEHAGPRINHVSLDKDKTFAVHTQGDAGSPQDQSLADMKEILNSFNNSIKFLAAESSQQGAAIGYQKREQHQRGSHQDATPADVDIASQTHGIASQNHDLASQPHDLASQTGLPYSRITRDATQTDVDLASQTEPPYSPSTAGDSGVSTGPGSISPANLAEHTLSDDPTTTCNATLGSNNGPMNSSKTWTSDSSSEKSSGSVYKFKHSILRRFSVDGRKPIPSDMPPNGSLGPRFRIIDAMDTVGVKANEESACSSKHNKDEKQSRYLSAFILHPRGTHYVPISVHSSSVNDKVFSKKRKSGYRPISITVDSSAQENDVIVEGADVTSSGRCVNFSSRHEGSSSGK